MIWEGLSSGRLSAAGKRLWCLHPPSPAVEQTEYILTHGCLILSRDECHMIYNLSVNLGE